MGIPAPIMPEEWDDSAQQSPNGTAVQGNHSHHQTQQTLDHVEESTWPPKYWVLMREVSVPLHDAQTIY